MSVGEKKARIEDSLTLIKTPGIGSYLQLKTIQTNKNKTRKTPSENTERDTQPWNL